MKQLLLSLIISIFIIHISLLAQVKFDYSAAESVIKHFSDTLNKNEQNIINHSGYQLILQHSRLFSSQPLTEKNLLNSLNGKDEGFDFLEIKMRSDTLRQIIQWLKNNEQEIINEFINLPLNYLPKDYMQNAIIYFVIGGYNGIAFNNKVCVNIDFKQFRKNNNEIKFYISHELFHIGFEKYHQLPDIFKAKTVKDLKTIVLSMTMNEGLATLTPYQKRIELNEISDYDYKTLLDSSALNKKIIQFQEVLKYLDENYNNEITNDILGNVLGQCSGDRLFYIIGCKMGLKIEERYGKQKIIDLIKEAPEQFFETYKVCK